MKRFGDGRWSLNVGLLLHLHKLLFAHTPGGGGTFTSSDNLVVDRSPDGSTEVRFVPVQAEPIIAPEGIGRSAVWRRRTNR